MEALPYKSKGGRQLFRPVLQDAGELMSDNNLGFCLACGATAYNVEPDARKRTCECCGEPKAYGLEELLLMGLLIIS